MRKRIGSELVSQKVDNSQIRAFMAECQQVVGQWNEVHDLSYGKLNLVLEPVHLPRSDEEHIRLIADTGRPGGRPSTLTLFIIRRKQEGDGFLGTVPLVLLSATRDIDIAEFRRIVMNFNPQH